MVELLHAFVQRKCILKMKLRLRTSHLYYLYSFRLLLIPSST